MIHREKEKTRSEHQWAVGQFQRSNMCVIGVSEGAEGHGRQKNTEKMMAITFPHLMRTIHPQVQQVQWVLSRRDIKKTKSMYIIMTLLCLSILICDVSMTIGPTSQCQGRAVPVGMRLSARVLLGPSVYPAQRCWPHFVAMIKPMIKRKS